VRIVLAAEEATGVRALRLVLSSPHQLGFVLTGSRAEDEARGLSVASVAREQGVPVLPAELVKDDGFAEDLRRDEVDVLLNVHSLHVISAAVLAAPRVGSFNLHPGPLPGYAGMNVPSWALYHGESTHGVTLHWVAPRIDAGPIAFRASFPLSEKDTGLTVSAACARHGLALIEQLLAGLSVDPVDVPALAQDPTARRYFGREVPNDGWVAWEAPAQRVTNFVRACDYGPWESPWGRPRTLHRGTEIAVGAARRTNLATSSLPGTIGSCNGETAHVATEDEWVVVSRLSVGGTAVSPEKLLTPGDVLDSPLGATRS
jgi:UDP-4-amino-4-deoxy-L-arabinose formyltransferase/UDP-glucuronic acid dehydrogenase (UDP-4-keto-hexauronic acid decarboxylating)